MVNRVANRAIICKVAIGIISLVKAEYLVLVVLFKGCYTVLL
jgi:hypothetical protein